MAAKKKPPVVAVPSALDIKQIRAERLLVPIVGTSALLQNRFSEKAKRQMLDAMQGIKSPKEPKNPEAEYLGAFYRLKDGRYGIPAAAFKQATISGARLFAAVTMTSLRSALFMKGEPSEDGTELFAIEGEPHMREDVVRVGRGGTDLRYRPQFDEWSTTLEITYVASMLTEGSVLSLIDAGGLGVGVGEWRPEKNGTFGTYRVDPSKKVVTFK